MANNSRVSRSASIEDLKEKNAQMEAELSKLADEVREVMKRQDESSKRQEESQKRIKESNRALDDKLSNLGLMMERTMRQISGKNPIPVMGGPSNVNGCNRYNEDSHNLNQGNGNELEREEEGLEHMFNMTREEFNWTNNYKKEREKAMRNDPRRGTNVQLPKMEFPHFDGGDPQRWRVNCEFYFEMFEVPENYKTRMAVMNFSEEIHEWYRCLVSGGHPLPWDLLIEEVMARFQGQNVKNPVDEFKRLHQIGKVEEFIKKFDRGRARLMSEKPTLDEDFFVAGFISGLKEEIRHNVELFNPRTLNSAYQYALRIETAQEVQNRKPREGSKGYKFQKYPPAKQKPEMDRLGSKEGLYQKPWQQKTSYTAPNYEQRKELGLCHKCHGKYYPGHQCTGKVMRMMTESFLETENSEEEEEISEPDEEVAEVVEQAMISMFTGSDKNKISSMKFNGYIGNTPICALVDSGSTHSFANPGMIKKTKDTN